MLPHRDRVVPLRGVQSPRHPPDYLCALTYLTDVGPDTPAFAVLPTSWAVQPPWDPLLLQPIYGAAGTLILCPDNHAAEVVAIKPRSVS